MFRPSWQKFVVAHWPYFAAGAGVLAGCGVAYALYRRAARQAHLRAGAATEAGFEDYGGHSRDAVDQASWESFPASDPPAW